MSEQVSVAELRILAETHIDVANADSYSQNDLTRRFAATALAAAAEIERLRGIVNQLTEIDMEAQEQKIKRLEQQVLELQATEWAKLYYDTPTEALRDEIQILSAENDRLRAELAEAVVIAYGQGRIEAQARQWVPEEVPDGPGWWAFEGKWNSNEITGTFRDIAEVQLFQGQLEVSLGNDWESVNRWIGKWYRLPLPWDAAPDAAGGSDNE